MLSVVREKTLESPLDRNKIKLFNPKGNQHWIFTGRTNTEAEAPILLPPDEKSQLIGKNPDAGKDWGQEEKGITEDEMVRWHLWLNGHDSEQTQGYSEGQGRLACCSSWGRKELDTTERLNNREGAREKRLLLVNLQQLNTMDITGLWSRHDLLGEQQPLPAWNFYIPVCLLFSASYTLKS